MKILKMLLDFPPAESWVINAFQSSASEALGEAYQSLTVAEAGQISEAANEFGKISLRSLRGEDVDAELAAWAAKWKGLNPAVLAAWDVKVVESKDDAQAKFAKLSTVVKDPVAYDAAEKLKVVAVEAKLG